MNVNIHSAVLNKGSCSCKPHVPGTCKSIQREYYRNKVKACIKIMPNLDLGQLFYAAARFIASSLHTVGLWWLNRRFRSIFLLTRGYDYTEQSTKNILLNIDETMAPRRNEVQQKNDNNKMNRQIFKWHFNSS